MAVQLPGSRKQDSLDTILKGLQIAGSIFNIKGAMEKSEALEQQRAQQLKLGEQQLAEGEFRQQEREALAQGQITPTRKARLLESGVQFVPQGTPGATSFGMTTGEKPVEMFGIAPKAMQKQPSPLELAKFQMSARKELRDIEKQQGERAKDIRERVTPFGLANTLQDAKNIKETLAEKEEFESLVNEMIELRKEYGAEFLNREAVGRGKQLSKQALLKLKNIAKLGVLSQSDEAIINAIVPPDPLGVSFGGTGGDPILNQLESLKSDIDSTFQRNLKNLLQGENISEQALPPPNGALRIRDKQTGQVFKWDGRQYKPENGMAGQ